MNSAAPMRATQFTCMLGIVLVYALCFAAIKAGLQFAPPLTFAGLRALIAGVALLGVLRLRGEPLLPARALWPGILALAFTATTLTFGAMFLSPGRTGAGIASVLGNMQALFTVALAAVFIGEALTRGKAIALVLGLLGVTLIAYPAIATADAYSISGAALALGASGSAAVSNVVAKRMNLKSALLGVAAWQLLVGSVPLFALAAWTERGANIVLNFEFTVLLLFLALAGTALLNTAWYWLLQFDDVSRLSLFFMLTPAFGLFLAALIFGETIGRVEIAGAGIIVIGIGILSHEAAKSQRTPLSSTS
ncbi:MAG: DMT family transporter [Anaerolineae bacterium]|nr:DMT family transporter [Anaerolineae bacterium]